MPRRRHGASSHFFDAVMTRAPRVPPVLLFRELSPVQILLSNTGGQYLDQTVCTERLRVQLSESSNIIHPLILLVLMR